MFSITKARCSYALLKSKPHKVFNWLIPNNFFIGKAQNSKQHRRAFYCYHCWQYSDRKITFFPGEIVAVSVSWCVGLNPHWQGSFQCTLKALVPKLVGHDPWGELEKGMAQKLTATQLPGFSIFPVEGSHPPGPSPNDAPPNSHGNVMHHTGWKLLIYTIIYVPILFYSIFKICTFYHLSTKRYLRRLTKTAENHNYTVIRELNFRRKWSKAMIWKTLLPHQIWDQIEPFQVAAQREPGRAMAFRAAICNVFLLVVHWHLRSSPLVMSLPPPGRLFGVWRFCF